MKKTCLMLISFLFLLMKAGAQNNLPPVYEITTDTAIRVVLDKSYCQMLEDRGDKLTIDEVSKSPIADRFHLNTTKTTGIDYSVNTFWFRYRLKNGMNHEARIAITEGGTYADFYSFDSINESNHKVTGA